MAPEPVPAVESPQLSEEQIRMAAITEEIAVLKQVVTSLGSPKEQSVAARLMQQHQDQIAHLEAEKIRIAPLGKKLGMARAKYNQCKKAQEQAEAKVNTA